MGKQYRIAIVFPADAGERSSTKLEQSRFSRVAAAIGALGVEVQGAPYADEAVDQVRAQLLRVDGVLIWINPIQAGRDRSILNAMLADVAVTGVFVSAHPEIIRKMGTKEPHAKNELGLRHPPLSNFAGDASEVSRMSGVRRPARSEADTWPERRWRLEGRVNKAGWFWPIRAASGRDCTRQARQAG